MKRINAIKCEFDKINFHKKLNFCHSIDKESYRILCEEFFLSQKNIDLETELAEKTNILCNESEKEFLCWLNLE